MTILVAHGSSDQNWANTFVEMTTLARQSKTDTQLAYMELNEPSIQTIVNNAVKEGFNHFVILPLFLARGKHLKRDIPDILKNLESELGITTELLAPIGEHPEIAEAIKNILNKN